MRAGEFHVSVAEPVSVIAHPVSFERSVYCVGRTGEDGGEHPGFLPHGKGSIRAAVVGE